MVDWEQGNSTVTPHLLPLTSGFTLLSVASLSLSRSFSVCLSLAMLPACLFAVRWSFT